ncbi:MAG: ROK family transcriptional regulator [Defluviitaleaceae bacterium]|nr:ROK family transcriptional regulator [Defluviitaleaceae bacterium]
MNAYVASHLKDMNRHVVYNFIKEQEVTSRAQIAKLTGISAPTVIKIISFLVDAGLVLELGEGESSIGRKPHMLTLNRDKFYSAVFFVEGNLLNFGVADIVGKIRYKKALRCELDFAKIMTQISSGLVDGLFAEVGIDLSKLMGIGIALPGVYNQAEQTLVTAPLIGVHEPICLSRIISDMEKKYNVRLLVENDVNCQCYGEFNASKMPKDSDLLLISIGTGLGAGLILDGKLRRGVNYMCGEIGYMSFMEDYMSGLDSSGWLESRISLQVLEKEFGIFYDMVSSQRNEEKVYAAVEYVSTPLALCISNMTMMLDCPAVRLSGLMLDILGDRLVDRVNEKLKRMCINQTKVQKQHSDDIGLIGISAMLTEQFIPHILMDKE